MNRNVTRANRSNQYHETEESDGILEPLGSHRQSIRELPPLPNSDEAECNLGSVTNQICADGEFTQQKPDFWASIEKVKQYGWYWGPVSGDAAEKLLNGEPDGSFLVRDSSDDRYIFSLTFKLNGHVRHVRIEHDQGNFSFGHLTNFKSNTIVDFIENAVQHSRSGRYLFFLHRRPVLGPMRVQLIHPVSRFKRVQSLQHQCRFVILKLVPRDLIHQLPVPVQIQKYLNTPFYYSEDIVADEGEIQKIIKSEDEWIQEAATPRQ